MTSPTPQPESRPFKWRYVFYAMALALVFFLILDGIIIWLEKGGHIDTQRKDDRVWLSTGNPWVAQGDRYVVGTSDKMSMVDMSFSVHKGNKWRAFMLGGSFMRGIPYKGAGTMRFWLNRALKSQYPDAEIELVNAAAVSQNSHRVKEIAQHAARLEADVLIIASCNNEGALAPDEVTKRLHKSGSFRLFKKWLRADTPNDQRPLHTPQDTDIDTVREQFRQNLTEMIRAGRAAGATVLLCTLPVNLRYEGNSPGRPITGPEHDSQVRWPQCVHDGYSLYQKQDYKGAVHQLNSCQHEEALRWTGLSLYGLNKVKRAKRLLEQYLEIVPRNRCRPSFNQVIREVAKAHGTPLIDLEAAAQSVVPDGLPGAEQFVSYCHMNWESQARMADTMLTELKKNNAAPKGRAVEAPAEDRGAIFEEMKKRPPAASY